VDYRGKETFAVWRYLPSLRWGLVVKIDTREAFFPVRRLAQSFLIILAVSSALIILAAIITSRLVVLPIRQLRDAASGLAARGLHEGLTSLPQPRNEIGDLSQSLQTMAEKLADAFQGLEQANATLEAKVADRTQELSAKNSELETTLHELRSAQERMVAQARMASLGQLTKGVAHEIKNPLNFVNNFATLSKELCNELRDVIHESPDIPEPITSETDSLLEMMRDNLHRIESHGKRADLIVSGMLEHSRAASSVELRETDLNHAIRTSIEVAQRMSVGVPSGNSSDGDEAGLELPVDLHFDATVTSLLAYPGDLCRAMVNVISNAFWAVSQQPPGTKPTIVITTVGAEDFVTVEIRDNGIGMAPDILKQATNPFFTTKPTGEGTGLGLSLAYDIIVELHKGAFDIHSEQGKGTTVTIQLNRHLTAV
jgi:signal transduction histidine kinase